MRQMHFVTHVEYEREYTLLLGFEDGTVRRVDLKEHLDGEVFEPLKDRRLFQTAHLNRDIDTVAWDNGADMSPDFLYDASVAVVTRPASKVAEEHARYGDEPQGEPRETE
jgi:hypothetical protein